MKYASSTLDAAAAIGWLVVAYLILRDWKMPENTELFVAVGLVNSAIAQVNLIVRRFLL